MKWWQIAWLVAVGIAGNVLFVALAVRVVADPPAIDDLGEIAAFCMQWFTLPAIGLYLVCAFLDWIVGLSRRAFGARRPRAARA